MAINMSVEARVQQMREAVQGMSAAEVLQVYALASGFFDEGVTRVDIRNTAQPNPEAIKIEKIKGEVVKSTEGLSNKIALDLISRTLLALVEGEEGHIGPALTAFWQEVSTLDQNNLAVQALSQLLHPVADIKVWDVNTYERVKNQIKKLQLSYNLVVATLPKGEKKEKLESAAQDFFKNFPATN